MNIENLKEIRGIIEFIFKCFSQISSGTDVAVGISLGVPIGFFFFISLFFLYTYLKYKRDYPFMILHNKVNIVIEDNLGKKAHYTKEQIAKPNWKGITRYIEHSIYATGETANFKTSIGKIEEVYCVGEIKHAKINFDKPLKEKPFTRYFEYDISDSFIDIHNYHLHKITAPEDKFSLEVEFPSTRPPRNPKAFQNIGVAEIEEKDPEIIPLPEGKTIIRWEKKRHLLYPLQIGTIFKIEWDW